MGIFDFLKSKKTIINHPFFGELNFAGSKVNYFEGNTLFPPLNKNVEFVISAPIEGPSQEQVNYFKNLSSSYLEIETQAKEIIEEEFRNWKEDFEIKDFQNEFNLVFISLPSLNNKSNEELELAFETKHDENHTFTVHYKDLKAIHVNIDG